MADTATAAEGLTATEQATLDKLLARASAGQSPATRIGEPYVALACLSVPRRGDKDKQCDLVYPGEVVHLTEEEARKFNRHDAGRDGRAVEVVRKLTGPGGSREQGPRLLPRHLSGRLFRPAMPPPGSDAPRPDPEGTSSIQVLEDGRAPEAGGAVPADPAEMADRLSDAAAPDALDLPPTRARTRGGR